ncbi:hypothetical protein F4775DRAFT_545362 [Biscogniauxia sp. FL1348]|nr:hypothetical protein F4775DRAFT_545362 [Biscogniauxia sp. FL1348]
MTAWLLTIMKASGSSPVQPSLVQSFFLLVCVSVCVCILFSLGHTMAQGLLCFFAFQSSLPLPLPSLLPSPPNHKRVDSGKVITTHRDG